MDQQSVDKIVLQFLQTTVVSLGTVSIQNLTGHFSQLPVDIRKKFNCTKAEVKKFLLAYPEVFVVNDETVSILQKKRKDVLNLVDMSVQCEIPTMDDNSDEVAEKKHLVNCKGKIKIVFDIYGFIEFSSSPISTTVYFDVTCFEDGKFKNLFKLNVGDDVNFNAKQSIGHKASYRATKVWRTNYPSSLQGSERCYSSNTSLASQDSYQSEMLNGAGKVMKITSNYGFIKPTGKAQGNVFFFRTKFQLPNAEEVKNLEEVTKDGDLLYFSAIQSRKKNADAPWEAVRVSKTPLENVRNGLSKHRSKSNINSTGSTSSTDCSYHSLGLDSECINDESHIYNQIGTIHQLTSDKPIIHFGKNEKAIILSNMIYKNSHLVEDYGWEIDEGTTVQFNAEYDDNIWRAMLVWIGDKPKSSNKKLHKKKTAQAKETTVSDLCEISLYDDQSDDGIWHTSSPHIDTGTWDEENSENWPALEPPVAIKTRSIENSKSQKSENNTKIFSERVNAISSSYEKKVGNEINTSSYATALLGDCQEMEVSTSKRKKHSNTNSSSYVTAVSALSTDPTQNKNDTSSDSERLERYKMNNGWEEDSFNTKSEKWPALNESIITPISNITKSNAHKSEEEFNGYINDNQCIIQNQMPFGLNNSTFVDRNNDLLENYYSDEFDAHEISSDGNNGSNLMIINEPQSFEKVSSLTKEINFDKFSDLMGTIINIQKYFAFIKADGLDQNLPFCWEQAYCDGCLVSKCYSDLCKAFNEFDLVNFTYCILIDENGKEWKNVLQVWKGKKPNETTAEYINHVPSESIFSEQKKDILVDIYKTSTNCKEACELDQSLPFCREQQKKENEAAINSSAITLTAANMGGNKNAEDSGVCVEDLETCEDDSKTVNGLSNFNLSTVSNTATSCREGKELTVETKNFTSAISSLTSETLSSQLKAAEESSYIEKNIKLNTSKSFLKYIYKLAPSPTPESVGSMGTVSSMLSDDSLISVRNQETQTEIVTCDQETQTFITGPVLSVEIFPH